MRLCVINDDANNIAVKCDMIVTDPPFDLSGVELAKIIEHQECDHLLLITTMKQLLEFNSSTSFKLAFDFVLDSVVPKKSKSIHQPNYTHVTCVYMTRNGAKSIFNRKKRERSDAFDSTGYWSTIMRSPRDRMNDLGYAKNITALTDIIGSFEVNLIADIFAGSGSTAYAAFELDIDCIVNEIDSLLCKKIESSFKMLGVKDLAI